MKNWIIIYDKGKYLAVEDTHDGVDRVLEEKGFTILAYVAAKTVKNALNCAEGFGYGH